MPYESDMETLTMVCTQAETVWESGENWAEKGRNLCAEDFRCTFDN